MKSKRECYEALIAGHKLVFTKGFGQPIIHLNQDGEQEDQRGDIKDFSFGNPNEWEIYVPKLKIAAICEWVKTSELSWAFPIGTSETKDASLGAGLPFIQNDGFKQFIGKTTRITVEEL